MIIFPIVIMASIIMYIYYKVAILRSKDSLIQVYTNAKARMALGIFILFFGVNQYLFYLTSFAIIVALIFAILGVMQFMRGYREAKHYKGEWRRLHS